jgi:cytochrome P450
VFTDDMRRDPYPIYRQLRSAAPVFQVPGTDLWMVLDHAGVKRVLTDVESFSSRVSATQGHGFEWLLFMDPPRHTHLRAIITRAFTPRSIASLEPRIRELSRALLDPLVERGEMDLCLDYSGPLPMQVIAEMIGLPTEDWPRLRRWSEAIMNLALTIVGDGDEARAASDAFAVADDEMRAYLERVGGERRRHPEDDLLTRLVLSEVDGVRLTPEEVVRFIQLLLAAGTETTTNLIGNAILSFIEHPEELARLRAAPELLPTAIEEVLRYRSPAQAMFRATRRDVELSGRVIPAGKMVLVGIGAANRDPEQFRDPDRFDVGRDPNPHIAFGHGIHFCLGAPLSRLEGRIALGDLLGRLTHIERASTGPWEPRRPFHVHGPNRLPIRFETAA